MLLPRPFIIKQRQQQQQLNNRHQRLQLSFLPAPLMSDTETWLSSWISLLKDTNEGLTLVTISKLSNNNQGFLMEILLLVLDPLSQELFLLNQEMFLWRLANESSMAIASIVERQDISLETAQNQRGPGPGPIFVN
jgi:hypothetical protein